MAGGAIGIPRKVSACSGHFPSISLLDDTDSTLGMSSLHPVTYPSTRTANQIAHSADDTDNGTIDHTMQKLFASMSLAYSSSAKLAAPQFKAYKGLRISVKEKMRLNNIVWREWHLQYVKKRKNTRRQKICNFLPQMDGIHCKPTIVLLEGKYWKRTNEVVKNEYMKWRVFYQERMKYWKPDSKQIPDFELLARVGEEGHGAISSFVKSQHIRAHYSPPEISKDEYQMDLSNDIFNTLQSVGFPQQTNRDLLGLESSDLMQPELIGLQPELDFEDFDNSESLQDQDIEELLADAMNLHMDQLKFTSGQKRPVFPDLSHVLETAMTPPPAYPALKRLKSSTTQSPVQTDILMNGLQQTHTNSSYGYCSSYPVLQTSGDHPSVTTTSDGMHTTHSGMHTTHSGMHTTHSGMHTTHSALHYQTTHTPAQLIPAQDNMQLVTSLSGNQPLDAPGPAYISNAQTSHGEYGPKSNMTSIQSTLQSPTPLTTDTSPSYYAHHISYNNNYVTSSTSLPSYPSSVSTSSYQTHTSGQYLNTVTSGSSYSVPMQQQQQLAPAGNSSGRGIPRSPDSTRALGVQPGGIVFKKPEAKPRPSKLKPEEKSSFLTQLLRKPLDKEAGQVTPPLASPDSTSPSHPVYFPQFTPISYTPQTSHSTRSPEVAPPDYRVAVVPKQGSDVIGKLTRTTSAGGTSAEDNGSFSAEEDKRETRTAEQKRRQQIKTGFDALAGLVPTIATTTTSKASKATMLTKTIDFITQLQQEEENVQREMNLLGNEIAALDMSISRCQSKLPATGIPMMSQHKDQMDSMLHSYVVEQTRKNWKFYVFSKLTGPLFDSFYSMVSTASLDDMYRSTQAWVDQHCSLVSLRPALLASLRDICSETSILTDPSRFADEAKDAIARLRTNSHASEYPHR